MKRFQTHYGCYPVGVEPGDSYRSYTQSQGIEVYADISKVNCELGEHFDLISMIHLLEHISDPIPYLLDLNRQFLDGNGYLLLEVPNLYFHDSFETAHMSSFSSHTLVETLKKSDFSVVTAMRHGAPRSKLLPLYVTVLSKASHNASSLAVKPERMVRWRRELGMLLKRVLLRLLPNQTWALPNVDWN